MKHTLHSALLGAAALLAFPAVAYAEEQKDTGQTDPGTWRISAGVNYSQGDYGDVQDTKVVSAPVAVKYKRGGFSLRVSVPYVHIDGPGSLLDTPQGRDAGFGDDSGFDDNGGSSGNDFEQFGFRIVEFQQRLGFLQFEQRIRIVRIEQWFGIFRFEWRIRIGWLWQFSLWGSG